MSEFFESYFTFYYVGVSLFALFGLVLLLKMASQSKPSKDNPTLITFKRLNQRFDKEKDKLQSLIQEHEPDKESSDHSPKQPWYQRILPWNWKRNKKKKNDDTPTKNTFVLNFVGDIMARNTEYLRDEISLILQVAKPEDEVVLCLNSPGGSVAQYGLAGSQLARLRSANIPLTVCVDVVAASGGYLMASVANKIVAAPFAYIGSIGVVAGIPNFHRVLKKHDVDYHLFTAGKYKRTVTPLSEVTDEGKEKFQESLVEVHDVFKQHLEEFRPQLDLEDVATGEHWLAIQAKEKALVDEIMTSDDYIIQCMDAGDVVELKTIENRSWPERFFKKTSYLLDQVNHLFTKTLSPTSFD